jgi:hypothetical protein
MNVHFQLMEIRSFLPYEYLAAAAAVPIISQRAENKLTDIIQFTLPKVP